MLKLIQKIVPSNESLNFAYNSEWSDNILPDNTVAYELTINGDAGNLFSLDKAEEPFVIKKMDNGITIPLAIYRHARPVKSLHIHRDNKYKTSTIINILISVDEKNLDQWLNEVTKLSEMVHLMYGEAFGPEDYDIGSQLNNLDKNVNFLYETINPDLWSTRNYELSIAKAIGGWGDTFENAQINNHSIWDITTAIHQGLIYDDTYLTEEV